MILSNITPDYRFGGVSGNVEPAFKKSFPKLPDIDLGQYQIRWQYLRLEAMSKWYQRWRDISRYVNPKRGYFEGFVPNYNAQYDYRLILDGDPAHYARIMAAGMTSGLTSPSRPWFRLGLEDDDLTQFEPVKIWLETVEKKILSIYAKSNLYGCHTQTYEELSLFGTGAFGIYEDYHTVARGRSYTIGEYYLGCDYTGRVNSFARQFWMTADQMEQEYGFENMSSLSQNAYRAGNRDQFFLIYQLCEPNTTLVPGRADFRGMKFRSVTWEAQAIYNRALRIKGYNEFPVMAPRWDMTTTADIYGVGPAWFRLGDIKMLYRMKKDLLMGVNKLVDPPVQVDAGVEGAVNTLPGGVTRNSSAVPNTGLRPAYEVQPDVNAISALIKDTKQQIASAFYADLFMMMIQSDMQSGSQRPTAREVAEKHEEKLLMLGPVLERIESDMLDPAIERIFGMCLRAGILPPPPPQIQGMPINVIYISLLAQAQQMVGTAAIEQGAAFVGSLGAVYPEAKDNFDPDEAVREYLTMLGVPAKIVRSQEQVAQIRDQRSKFLADQQAKQDAATAVQGAQILSNTKVGGANALEHLMGIGGEQSQQQGTA